MCLFSSEGLSKAFRQTSQGNSVRSPRLDLFLIDVCLGLFNVVSESISPTNEAVVDSSDSDFRSSVSKALGGEDDVEEDEFIRDRDNNDVDKSNGESANKPTKKKTK